jgi:hypothetical protein
MISEPLIPDERSLPTGWLQRRGAHLVSEIGVPTKSRRPVRLRWMLAAAAGVLVAAVSAVFVGTGTKGDGIASAATAVLREAAAVAGRQPPPEHPGAGRYLYTKSETAYLSTSVYGEDLAFTVLVPRRREVWIGEDGGWIRQSSGKPRFLTQRDRENWIAAGRPELREPDFEERLDPAPPLKLPSDPDALYAQLERRAKGHPEGTHEEMFTLVGDALRESMATPAQRAALYEVAARLPGVDLVGSVKDPAGRPGLAVAMPMEADGVRHTLVFDPETAVLLAETEIALENPFGYPEGEIVGYATYLDAKVVEEAPRG